MSEQTTPPDSPGALDETEAEVVPALAYYGKNPRPSAARTFAVIGCRVLALFVVYVGTVWLGYLIPALLTAVGSGFSGFSGGRGVESLAAVAGPFTASCVLALLLWWKAEWLADRMIGREIEPVFPGGRQESPPGESTPGETRALPVSSAPAAPAGGEGGSPSLAQSVALAAVGALVLSAGLPELFRSLFVAVFDRQRDFSAWWRSIDWHGQLWAGVLKCALGFWLLLGSRGVARFVSNLRHVDSTRRDGNEGDRMELAGEPASGGDEGATR
jgi:hypothetical protein